VPVWLFQDLVIEFLKPDSLLATEMEIFKAFWKWSQGVEKSESMRDGSTISACVRLHRMSAKQLLEVVRPTGLVPDSKLVDAFGKKHGFGVPETLM
jgi:hypothetical protein